MAAKGYQRFGVKTLYRVEAVGKPRARDRYFDPSVTLVEERVVVVSARSHAEAIRKAENEAKKYVRSGTYLNPYGQRVRQRFLGSLDSYEIGDPEVSGPEVFSATFLSPRAVSDKRLIELHLLRPEGKVTHGKRRNFLNQEFSGRAGA